MGDGGIGEGDADDRPTQARLELRGRAIGDDPALVDDRDAVGQPVRLLEVLGGEQQCAALGDELLDHMPQVAATRRVEPGRRLVEEEHGRAVDQRGGQVEPAPHAAGVGLGRAIGGVAEPEPLEQLVGPGGDRTLGQVGEPADEAQVLPARQVLVDRGVLPGEADALADGLGMAGHVHAEDLGVTAVGVEDGGEDAHGRRLAGAVGPEQPEHGARCRGKVDTGEGLHLAEALGQALDPDGRTRSGRLARGDGGGCHGDDHRADH
jgi:hypothetical protein